MSGSGLAAGMSTKTPIVASRPRRWSAVVVAGSTAASGIEPPFGLHGRRSWRSRPSPARGRPSVRRARRPDRHRRPRTYRCGGSRGPRSGQPGRDARADDERADVRPAAASGGGGSRHRALPRVGPELGPDGKRAPRPRHPQHHQPPVAGPVSPSCPCRGRGAGRGEGRIAGWASVNKPPTRP